MEPVVLELEAPLEIARWRPLVHWLLAIPALVVTSVLRSVAQMLTVISFFTILFTKSIPDGIYDFQAMHLRYQWRVTSYFLWLREPYPPFAFEMQIDDPGDDPAVLSLAPQEPLSRWLPFVKWLLLIPHYFVLFFLIVGEMFVFIAAFFAVLFTGRWPQGMRNYVVGVTRWTFRVESYLYLLHDQYPPVSLT